MPRQQQSSDRGEQELREAYRRLEQVVPRWVARPLRWLYHPEARWIRLPLGILFIVASFFWFLPVIGLELLPLGLLLIALDVPFLRRPIARAVLWMVDRWLDLRRWLRRWWRSRR